LAVNAESANWRLLGGGGLILGGVLSLVATILGSVAPGAIVPWLYIVAFLVLGAALVFVAFGQTGSNGAVGNSIFGKYSLVAYAAGWVLAAVFLLLGQFGVAIASVTSWIIAVLLVVGGILSAIAICQKGVARGAAQWALFAPAIFGIVYVLAVQGIIPGGLWVDLILAVLFALTGVLYLLNTKKIG
jgi:hypothetical protein